MNQNANWAFYLYGFTQSDCASKVATALPSETARLLATTADPAVLESRGIDGEHPPFCWRSGDLASILSLVSREEFCGSAADSNLQDLTWLGPRIHRHQAVLEQAMRFGSILPARFGTLFSSLAVLDQFMERHRETIVDFLERVAGREEWAVKGLLDRARAEEELCRRQHAQGKVPPASSPGLAYLEEQRWRLKARQELEDGLAGACSALLEELTPLASESCARQVPSRQTTGADQEMVLNWAFLVPQRAAADFQKLVEQANAGQTLAGFTFTWSGPWPPYSFCPELAAEPA